MVAIDPVGRMGVTPVYREAAARWWAQQDLYPPSIHGFQYLPQSAILFTPTTATSERHVVRSRWFKSGAGFEPASFRL
jgi:hypothetical protein